MTEELQEWLEKADWDWRSAGDSLGLPVVNAGLVVFLCQQSIEKIIKAAIIARGETPPKIHDLISLSRRLSRLEPGWKWDEKELERLTKGAVDYRYPGIKISVGSAKEAYEIAGRLRTAVLPLLSTP